MSLSETNALRIKLGLQPIGPTSGTAKDGEVQGEMAEEVDGVDRDEWGRIIVPIDNIADKKHEDKLREKIEVRREKRKAERFLKINTLGASTKPIQRKRRVDIEEEGGVDDDDDLDMASWLKTQETQSAKNKRKFNRLQSRYEEEDQRRLAQTYDAKDMTGLTVSHKLDDLDDEKDIILTLKDKKILDEDAVKDVLQNVNVVDVESGRQNIDNRKQGRDYNPWENEGDHLEDMISFGKKSSTLRKYDEIIHGKKSLDTFAIGEDGQIDNSEQLEREKERAKLLEGSVSLALPEYKPQTDYMVAADFKKKKKESSRKEKKTRTGKVKGMKRLAKLTADDLVGANMKQEKYDGFHMDRKRVNQRSRRRVEDDEEETAAFKKAARAERKLGTALIDVDSRITRKSRKKKKSNYVDRSEFLEKIARDKEESESEEEFDVLEHIHDRKKKEDSTITLTTTEEFCRNIKMETDGNRRRRKEKMKKEAEEKQEKEEAMDDDDDAKSVLPSHERVGELIGMKDESTIDSGMAAFLRLAREKSVLDQVVTNKKLAIQLSDDMKQSIMAKPNSYHSLDDKFRYDHDIDRLGHRRLGRFDGSGVSKRFQNFEEKDSYKPSFTLSYTDKDGNPQDAKEAFRAMSHKFHGKQSGKIKTDKRKKKIKEVLASNRSVYHNKSIMTDMLKRKQKAEKQAFVVLAGQEASVTKIGK